MSRVLVTGGAGFLGSHLVDQLIKLGNKTIVVDNLSTGHTSNLNKKTEFIKLDIKNKLFPETIIKIKPDYIFHLAAQTSISKSLNNPRDDFKTNLFSIVPILEAAVKIGLKKFFFASSAAVYGETRKVSTNEYFPKNPSSPYGIAKLTSEFLIKTYYKNKKLPYVIFRYSNIYGPRQDSSSEGGVVSIFINNILKGKPVSIVGTGNQTRDFIFISDVIKANLLLLEKKTIGTFNVSTAERISINKLIEKIYKVAKIKPSILYVAPKYIEAKNSCLSWEKIRKETKWYPAILIDQGLSETYKYFKSLKINST